MSRGLCIVAATALTFAASNIGVASPSPADKCVASAFPHSDGVTIRSVERRQAPSPHCRVDGYVTTQDPGPNRVNFMLALPDNFNGRYVMTIQGGAAGFVPDPAATQLATGYAIASTDKGTRPANILDFSWRKDPAQARDWAYRGVHVSAQATQRLTRTYYGDRSFHRFAQGCSGGGDGTLSNAELYPGDFDGYVAAAMSTSNLEINHIWGAIAQYMYKNPLSWISPEEWAQVHSTMLSRHDGDDGAIDGLIWNPMGIKLDREDFPYLSDAQFGLMNFISSGLKPEQGTSYPGYWLGNVTAFPSFLTGTKRPPWTDLQDYPAGFMVTATGAKGFKGPDYDILQAMNYSDRAALIADRDFQAANGRYQFDPARIDALEKIGGKLILWSGAADQAVPPENVLAYSNALVARHGEAKAGKFLRTFFVPGLHHCSTGEGAPTDAPDQLLEAMAMWVETGKAPEMVIAGNPSRTGGNTVTGLGDGPVATPATRHYKLCAFPARSHFIGGIGNPTKLDINDAANWRCVK
ncbi:tannase/feruloyl esterase family alpha/beta hydrolase [Sphingopyxis granuli]|nr:tannase/feruloyl esterase family alpha/beta hydrolase [Sphingopyxis granuli]